MQQATAIGTTVIGLEEALRMDPQESIRYEVQHLTPRIIKLLEFAGLAVPQVRASGAYVWDRTGRRYIDLFGYAGSQNFGYNHPRLLAAMDRVAEMPNLAEGPNTLAGILAHNLSVMLPGNLTRAYLGNSGTEAIDAAIKMARAVTGRPGIVACQAAFHGRSIGALSLTDRADYRQPFEPLVPGGRIVRFGDTEALERALADKAVAAYIVEPIQGEAGMIVPPPGYLADVRALCSKYGTLLVFDEIQTGVGRTGRFVACQHESVVPDCLLLGKGLGAGLMPLSALLTTDDLWRAAHADTSSSPFHFATYSGNARACAVGIAALELMVEENLAGQAEDSGNYLLRRLQDLQSRQPLISAVRGRGMMVGLEFSSGKVGPGSVGMAVPASAQGDAQQLFVGLLIRRLSREHSIITANTLHNPNVLRLQPPLNVEREVLDYTVDSLDKALQYLSRFQEAMLEALPDIMRFLQSDTLTGAFE
jgi:putrescine aminotransferase